MVPLGGLMEVFHQYQTSCCWLAATLPAAEVPPVPIAPVVSEPTPNFTELANAPPGPFDGTPFTSLSVTG